ncbi:MAG TPA: NAD-dependent deacylase [Nitrospiria bacterium]|nr:NAD-dependent deacylase [Nitrospiria bacterium]
MDSDIQTVRQKLSAAQRVTVLTGAGISADSGVPTFRGSDGLWRNFRAEDLATPEAFQRDPVLVWEWYNWRRELIASKRPNAGHAALVHLEKTIPDFTLISQNVDGLHGLAGSKNLIEIHGNIWKVRCTGCGMVKEDRRVPIPVPPDCSSCGKMLRPHIVWFGESLHPEDMRKAISALGGCDVMLVIGTSGVVQPAASFAGEARSQGAFVVEVNPDTGTPLAHIHLQGRAAEVMPGLV